MYIHDGRKLSKQQLAGSPFCQIIPVNELEEIADQLVKETPPPNNHYVTEQARDLWWDLSGN